MILVKLIKDLIVFFVGIDGLAIEINNYVHLMKERNFEFIMRLSSSIKNGKVLYTDLNGFHVRYTIIVINFFTFISI